jgi:hypothetical protein
MREKQRDGKPADQEATSHANVRDADQAEQEDAHVPA